MIYYPMNDATAVFIEDLKDKGWEIEEKKDVRVNAWTEVHKITAKKNGVVLSAKMEEEK